MKKIILLSLLVFSTTTSISQFKEVKSIDLKLSFETEHFNSNTYEFEKITFLDSTPRLSYIFNIKGRELLVAFFLSEDSNQEDIIATYINFANTWKKLHQSNLKHSIVTEELKLYTLNSKKFVYFEYMNQPSGTSNFNSYNFNLYDILENEIYTLSCGGVMNYDKSEIRLENPDFQFENLLEYPDILTILEKEASVSERIIR